MRSASRTIEGMRPRAALRAMAPFVLLVVLWQILVQTFEVSPLVFPSVPAVLRTGLAGLAEQYPEVY